MSELKIERQTPPSNLLSRGPAAAAPFRPSSRMQTKPDRAAGALRRREGASAVGAASLAGARRRASEGVRSGGALRVTAPSGCWDWRRRAPLPPPTPPPSRYV